MTIRTLFLLKLKSFVRNPLVEQMIMVRILIGIYVISLLYIINIFGSFLGQFANVLFPEKTSPLIIFLCYALIFFIVDFVLKYLFKNNDNNNYINLLRFFGSKKNINIFIVLKELFNLWNYYLPVLFFSYLINYIYPDYGLYNTITMFFVVCITQILLSLWIGKIKSNNNGIKIISILSLDILPESVLTNYLVLNIKMILRAPRLRQTLLSYLFLTAVFLYLIKNNIHTGSLSILLFFVISLFLFFPKMLFNQFLFSSEASFFDHLMISPGFKKILTAKYILFLSFSCLSFFLLLFTVPLSWECFIELTAIFLYIIGVITLLSFCSILFVNTKMDLFGSFYKSFNNTNSLQALIVLLVFFLSTLLVIFTSWLFSPQTATYFMLISGITFILFNQRWFNYLYRCFYPNKYEKMEIFRIQ